MLHTCEKLERDGFEVTYLPVDQLGRVAVEDVQEALREDTILVTIMYGNNEVGTIQPIAEIGELLREHHATFHTDAVQAYGLEKIDVNQLQVDLLSVSAHKINGPKGVGFLYQKTGTPLASFALGGAQEKNVAQVLKIFQPLLVLRLLCKLQISCVKKSVHYTITLSKLCSKFLHRKS